MPDLSTDAPPDELLAFSRQQDTPRWLVQAAQAVMERDPVKAANEAEAFAEILNRRAQRILEESLASMPKS